MAHGKTLNKNIARIAILFREVLERERIPIEKVIIFGSHAKGSARYGSDIDICVVSPRFGKDPIRETMFLLRRRRGVDSRIEPIPVSPKEYRETATPLIWEIKKHGKEVYAGTRR